MKGEGLFSQNKWEILDRLLFVLQMAMIYFRVIQTLIQSDWVENNEG